MRFVFAFGHDDHITELIQVFLSLGGRFTLSDDSHGVEQVGLNYPRVLDAIRQAGIESVFYFERTDPDTPVENGQITDVSTFSIPVAQLEAHAFWSALSTDQL